MTLTPQVGVSISLAPSRPDKLWLTAALYLLIILFFIISDRDQLMFVY